MCLVFYTIIDIYIYIYIFKILYTLYNVQNQINGYHSYLQLLEYDNRFIEQNYLRLFISCFTVAICFNELPELVLKHIEIEMHDSYSILHNVS